MTVLWWLPANCVTDIEEELAKVKKAYEKDTKIYLAKEDEANHLQKKVQVSQSVMSHHLHGLGRGRCHPVDKAVSTGMISHTHSPGTRIPGLRGNLCPGLINFHHHLFLVFGFFFTFFFLFSFLFFFPSSFSFSSSPFFFIFFFFVFSFFSFFFFSSSFLFWFMWSTAKCFLAVADPGGGGDSAAGKMQKGRNWFAGK